ncbi:MAG: hypothetical protein RL885_17215 [Planctomycetota bacterium]
MRGLYGLAGSAATGDRAGFEAPASGTILPGASGPSWHDPAGCDQVACDYGNAWVDLH